MISVKNKKRIFQGMVVSSSMNKTIVVQVDRTVVHPKYGKRYVTSKRFHVHDEQNEAQVGQKVSFFECRPISKKKRWCLLSKNQEKK